MEKERRQQIGQLLLFIIATVLRETCVPLEFRLYIAAQVGTHVH